MVTDINGMSHRPAGTVGGGRFENKADMTSDNDLDALFDDGADLGAMRGGKERRALEKDVRERREHAARAAARIGVALQDGDVKRYIVRGILHDGKAIVEVPCRHGEAFATRTLLSEKGQAEVFADDGMNPSYSLDHIRDKWGERGVNMKFENVGNDSLRCVFYPVRNVEDRTPAPHADGEFLKAKRGNYDGSAIPFDALTEEGRNAVLARVKEWGEMDERLGDERYFSKAMDRRVDESFAGYGAARLAYPDGFDGEAYARARGGEFRGSDGGFVRYDFGEDGRLGGMGDVLIDGHGINMAGHHRDRLAAKGNRVTIDFDKDCICLRNAEGADGSAPIIPLGD